MRDKITKAIKVILACAIVFLVAAPVIVGVYDAANAQADEVPVEAVGSIVEESGVGGRGRIPGDRLAGGLADAERGDEVGAPDDKGASQEAGVSVDDWYSGDPAVGDLLASGGAHLVYEFADGSIVDFGNPYVLDWSDVPMPDDYDEVVNGSGEPDSIFAPEKAYAGPISWIGSKLKMLAIKSGYWKSFNSMLYSMAITVCMSAGMNYTAATQCVNKVVAELPAITRVITSETAVFTTEDTAMLVSNSIARVAARKVAASEFPAALNAEIAANVTAVETTGMLAGGASGNFINALYQLAATGGVPASILYSDIGLYIGSWLGGQFDAFDDVPGADLPSAPGAVIDVDGNDLHVQFGEPPILEGVPSNMVLSFAANNWVMTVPSDDYHFPDGYLQLFSKPDANPTVTIRRYTKNGFSGWNISYGTGISSCFDRDGVYQGTYGSSGRLLVKDGCDFWISPSRNVDVQNLDGVSIGSYAVGFGWSGDSLVSVDGEAPANLYFNGQIVGQNAMHDDAGNITDYGNVTVPDVTAPEYQAPNTWQGALEQMGAAAIEQGATVTDPVIGKPDGTIGDWIGQNQTPAPKPSEGSQEDFKVEDLEKVFPFCIPWDIYYLLAALAADPVAPNIEFDFDLSEFGFEVYTFGVDFAEYDQLFSILRVGEVLLFCVGLAYSTRALIRG